MTKEITLKENYDIGQASSMVKMSTVLKQHVVEQKLFTPISGKNYVQVEGWQFAGGLMGLYPRIAKVENLSNDKEIKWKADVEIVRLADDKIVGYGFAVCSNKEGRKKMFDEYAILSMAQTRAIGKAYRNLVGWVMKLAGYEGTPSEEMTNLDEALRPKPVRPNDGPQEVNTPIPVEITPAAKVKPPECFECAAVITLAEARFSKARFKKQLCRDCQKGKK